MEPESMGLVLLLFSTVLLAVVSRVVIRMGAEGSMGPNAAMGIRTRHLKASAEAWRAGHAAALPVARRAGWVAVAAIGVAVPVAVWTGGQWAIGVGLAGLLSVSAVLFRASQVANRAARSVRPGPESGGG